ncbi:hypothetical protein MJO28_010602 [Puccinia striiformis f. sp. tritici]|uniref:Uncharacterized protein n=2 Tax=Puccinia striiformis TaxID=27350 RepID=A0A2S4UWU8_9BASI|nr:hypothetical protein MJO28_010602 [Puccinia striiformis f. sp. tritici]KAI7948677.1 hypothetical protein MJO29_010342 [Puccinia striiformis f. sp. tritici]POW01764.1 hypothetical protein PSTT_12242 [Puccinia striiformis]
MDLRHGSTLVNHVISKQNHITPVDGERNKSQRALGIWEADITGWHQLNRDLSHSAAVLRRVSRLSAREPAPAGNLDLRPPFIPSEAEEVQRIPYYNFGDLLGPEDGVTDPEKPSAFEFYALPPPTVLPARFNKFGDLLLPRGGVHKPKVNHQAHEFRASPVANDLPAQSIQQSREQPSFVTTTSMHLPLSPFPPAPEQPTVNFPLNQVGQYDETSHAGSPSISTRPPSYNIVRSPSESSRDYPRRIQLTPNTKRPKLSHKPAGSPDEITGHHHQDKPPYELIDVVPHKERIHSTRNLYLPVIIPTLLNTYFEKFKNLLTDANLPTGYYELQLIDGDERAGLCKFWKENKDPVIVLRVFNSHNRALKTNFLKASMLGLVKWVHYTNKALMNKLKIKAHKQDEYETELMEWLYSETFKPTHDLPALGIVDPERVLSYNQNFPFGTVQRHLIDYLTRKLPNNYALTKAIIIVGIWYKNLHPEIWIWADDFSYSSWIEAEVLATLAERGNRRWGTPRDTQVDDSLHL